VREGVVEAGGWARRDFLHLAQRVDAAKEVVEVRRWVSKP